MEFKAGNFLYRMFTPKSILGYSGVYFLKYLQKSRLISNSAAEIY